MPGPEGILAYFGSQRLLLRAKPPALRQVFKSDLRRSGGPVQLDYYVADKAPALYRRLEEIKRTIDDGNILTAVRETLSRIPASPPFRESHFGEVAATLIGHELLKLTLVYSKLRLLTTQNANVYKMDVLMCNPDLDPVEFFMLEAKTSTKHANDGMPPGHDKSLYPSLFGSLREFTTEDEEFDLVAARDNVDDMAPAVREKVRHALKAYANRVVRYHGVVLIDATTFTAAEAAELHDRKSGREFDVDLLCIEALKDVIDSTFAYLEEVKNASTPKKK